MQLRYKYKRMAWPSLCTLPKGRAWKLEPLDIIIRMQPRQSVEHSYSRCPGWPFPAFPYFIIELFQKKFSRRLW